MLDIYEEDVYIVGIKLDNEFAWYLAYFTELFFDVERHDADFLAKMNTYGWFSEEKKREFIQKSSMAKSVDETNAHEFLAKLQDLQHMKKITVAELREELALHSEYHPEKVFWRFIPRLYIDFDDLQFYSMSKHEDLAIYAPLHWYSKNEIFIEKIKMADRYWYDEFGKNLMNYEKLESPFC